MLVTHVHGKLTTVAVVRRSFGIVRNAFGNHLSCAAILYTYLLYITFSSLTLLHEYPTFHHSHTFHLVYCEEHIDCHYHCDIAKEGVQVDTALLLPQISQTAPGRRKIGKLLVSVTHDTKHLDKCLRAYNTVCKLYLIFWQLAFICQQDSTLFDRGFFHVSFLFWRKAGERQTAVEKWR